MNQRTEESTSGYRLRMKPFRCMCGSMLARLVPGGVELKCRRCKRQVVIPLERSEDKNIRNEI